MMKKVLTTVALILSGLHLCLAQTTQQKHELLLAETEKRIAGLNKKFEEILATTPVEKELLAACAVNCSDNALQIALHGVAAKRMAAMNDVISHIHAGIDAYLSRAVDPRQADLNHSSVEQELKQVLAPPPNFGESPSAFVLNSTKGRSLIVAYVLHKGAMMGEGSTSVTIRAYSATGNGVHFSDSTGDNMDGYGNISVKELNSPVSDETWLLVSGHMTGANGPNIRMRIYAYDGTRFRTIWMPANAWGAFTIAVTDHGFTVDGPYYREHKERHDEYVLAPDGLYVAPSR